MAKTISFIFYALGFILLPLSFIQIEENGDIHFIVFTLNNFSLAIALIAIGYLLGSREKPPKKSQINE